MSSKLLYNVKGEVDAGVHKSYFEMSDAEIEKLMRTERFSLTCAPGGENNRGMEIIGRMPIKGEGFTAQDIENLGPYFECLMPPVMDKDKKLCFPKASVLDLNVLSLNDVVDDLGDEDQARVLLLRNWATNAMGDEGWTKGVYKELASRRWDAEYLDPNKYRTEIIDGKEVKVRGKPMTKRARTNLCFVDGREQEPAVLEGKGSIYDLKKMSILDQGVKRLREQIADGLIKIGSKTKVEINVVEGNRYYDLKNTGIGFHGDTERVVVICISIGCSNYPMRWQWFKDGMPVGRPIDITLNCGDVYIMSEKAVGADWKLRSKYTLRHSAGAKKYRDLGKWEKRREGYEAKKAVRATTNTAKELERLAKQEQREKLKEERFVAKNLKTAERLAKQEQREKLKEERAAAKSLKVAKNDKKNKAKTTCGGNLKNQKCSEKSLFQKYKTALNKHDWEEGDASFYEWVAIEASHSCSPKSEFFKEFQDIWTGKAENYCAKMDFKVWEEQKTFYKSLCEYRRMGV